MVSIHGIKVWVLNHEKASSVQIKMQIEMKLLIYFNKTCLYRDSFKKVARIETAFPILRKNLFKNKKMYLLVLRNRRELIKPQI